MNTKDVFLLKWFVLDAPWGDGRAVLAGNPDPHQGLIVCEHEFADFNPESYEDISVQDIMKHIAETHNDWLSCSRAIIAKFLEGWSNFCKHINFASSFLSAEDIKWMNEIDILAKKVNSHGRK